MPWKKVQTYSLGYRVQDRKFLLNYTVEADNAAHQLFTTAEELLALAHIFSEAGPVSFNTDGNYFTTDFRTVGT